MIDFKGFFLFEKKIVKILKKNCDIVSGVFFLKIQTLPRPLSWKERGDELERT